MTRLSTCGVLLFAAVAGPAQTPTIRVTTRLVEINVIVRNASGPVRDLAKEDFTLFDNGRPRDIAVFAVNTGRSRTAPRELLAENEYTNRVDVRSDAPNGLTIVLFDAVNTSAADQLYVKKQFLSFLRKVRPQDRIAVYSMGGRLSVLHDFTSDAGRLAAALGRYGANIGDSPDKYTPVRFNTGDEKLDAVWNDFLGREEQADKDRRVDLTVEAMEAIAKHVGRLPGRKSLIWMSAAFPLIQQGVVGLRSVNPEIRRASRALNDANVAVYPVDARGLIGMPQYHAASQSPPPLILMTPSNHDTMQNFALRTGGRAFMNRNDLDTGIRELMDDSEYSYTLGFYPEDVKSESTRSIKVKVNRAGVQVRHRENYIARPDGAAPVEESSEAIRTAVRNPLESTQLLLSVRVERGESLKFTIKVSASDLALAVKDGRWTGSIDAVFAQRSAEGGDLGTTRHNLKIDFDRAQYDDAIRNGVRIHKTITPAAGTAEFKLVIADRMSGRMGSLVVPLKP